MVVLDVDHPDIREFIWCKAKEEDKAAALRDAGFDMSIDGDGFHSIQYQNANNSVRVNDAFMRAVENDEDWNLLSRTTSEPVDEPIPARELMQEIAEAAWRCADPGVQYDTTINQWHTCPNSGRINASNPCSEYMHVDDSACNLASLNLMKFRRADGTFDVQSFEHAVDIVFLAQEIIVSPSSYPTEQIAQNARAFRQLGLGYANLGAFLMADGVPYDSDAGRGTAAAITSLMTGRAYLGSARIAAQMGPYDRYAENRDAHNAVMRLHRDASYAIPDSTCVDTALLQSARTSWEEAVAAGEQYGYRNAQATVLAPTGTISFLMDCDTTGVEPDFSLVKFKELVGGGQMTIVNRTVPLALQTLGYNEAQIEQILAYVNEHGTIIGAPELAAKHLPVFDVAVGERAISHMGHIKIMGAVQPFISRRHLQNRESARGRDGRGHRRRLPSGLASRHRGAGHLSRRLKDGPGATHRRSEGRAGLGGQRAGHRRGGGRRAGQGSAQAAPGCRASASRSPTSSRSAAMRATSPPGCTRTARSARSSSPTSARRARRCAGMMNSFATAISISLQYGVPLRALVRKFSYMRFEPEGMTSNPEIPFAKSMPDYIMRWLASRFLDVDLQEELGILTPEVRARKAAQDAMVSQAGDTAGPIQPEAGVATPTAEGNGGASVAATSALTDSPPVVPGGLRAGASTSGPRASSAGG